MRIGLNLLFLLPGVVGGTESYAISLINALTRIDEQSEYFVFTNQESTNLSIPASKRINSVSCNVFATNRASRYAWEQLILPRKVKSLQIELLHSLGYVQPLRLPCKSVVTIHDLNFYNIGHMMSKTKRIALQFFVTRSAKAADHIITVSEFSKKQIVEILGVPPEIVTVTYNAMKERPYHLVEFEELKSKYNIRQPYIFGLSSPSPHKNIANLVWGFAHLKQRGANDLKLVLAGHLPKGSNDLTKALDDVNIRVREDIIFVGYVPDSVLPSLYSYADAFVFPSLYEGFGIPILEAFSCGTPVVCSKMAAIPEVAGDASIYFDPHNIEEMADAILKVLIDGSLRNELIERGKSRLKLFSWEKTAEQTLAVYKKVLSSS
ncbi:glycosyltransferase family 4 protein [Acetomicrobium sp.]|jgi:glycosyltransferase involved in cell wall biosynthesis|uniref:glycosyltransferase family 4 protein n=1 Tax=Acetomicrobium sp. TaxID=1872099 RepID=UPI003D97DACB